MESETWLVECYQQIALLSGQMLDAAKASQWDDLIEIETRRSAVISELRTESEEQLMPDSISGQVGEMIASTLEFDAQVAALVRDWRSELGAILSSLDAEKKLNKAYGP